jgi:hypothetical protein
MSQVYFLPLFNIDACSIVEPEPQEQELFPLAKPDCILDPVRIWIRIRHKWNDKNKSVKNKIKNELTTFWAIMLLLLTFKKGKILYNIFYLKNCAKYDLDPYTDFDPESKLFKTERIYVYAFKCGEGTFNMMKKVKCGMYSYFIYNSVRKKMYLQCFVLSPRHGQVIIIESLQSCTRECSVLQ